MANKKICKIGFNEIFIMYVYISFKNIKATKSALESAGFKCKTKDMDSDHELKITVTPKTASIAHYIIEQNK